VQLRVRDAADRDAGEIARIYRPYVEESVASFEDVSPDGAEMLRRMHGSPRLPWLVAEDAEDAGGTVVGYAYAARHRERAAYRWSVDCSVYVDPGARRRGVGRLLYGELLPLLRTLGYFRAYAGIALPNPASVGLHEAVGFTPVGVYRNVGFKHDGWHDVGWWQLSLRDADQAAQPPEPTPWQPSTD
jgi:L-amino acid N-acyltransferase YncA